MGISGSIDLKPADSKLLEQLLEKFLPESEIWAFGSRIKWTAKPNSDLDLVAFNAGKVAVSNLKEALADSDLSISVDLHVWNELPEKFRKNIEDKYLILRQGSSILSELPDGWISEILANCTSDGNIPYGIVQPGRPSADGVPMIRVNNIRDGRLDLNEVMRVSPEIEKRYKRTRLIGGEVLLTLVGSTGQSVVVPKELKGWNVARAIAVIKPKQEISANWINICLKTGAAQHFLDVRANTTVQKTLNLKDVKEIPIVFPPENELKQIEEVAVAIDEKIELNRRMNATLEAMARALFQSWFVDFDPVRRNAARLQNQPSPQPSPIGRGRSAAQGEGAAGFDSLFPDSFEDSAMGEIPKGWGAGKIKDCCTQIQNGGTPKRSETRFWEGGEIPWLASGEVRQAIITSTESFITDEGLAKSSAKWVPAFSTLIALYGATAGQVSFTSSRLTTNQAVCALIPKKGFTFFNYLTMRKATAELENKAVGSAQQNISKGIVEETQVVLPSAALVKRFTEAVSPLFDRWISNLHQSRNLVNLRDTLLPKLLNGELCVENL